MKLRNPLAVLCVLSISIAASSQTYLGRILGTVTDKSNAIVTKAKVSIVNVGTSATRNLETNEAGEYVAPNLAPGDYKVLVDAAGFKKVERTGIRLEVAKDARIDFQLQPGTETESITVTAEAPLIETTNNTLGGTFSNKSINDLPLNGRDFQNLVVLRPGVQRSPGGGFLSISSNGNRPEDNNFIVDGTDNNDPYYGTTVINAEGVQGTPGSILPIDAIQEFNAQENPPAEYGWKPGAIVNLGLKSGTNHFHGTGYYFHRNNMFDARNYFNNKPDPQKKLLLHQYGFSAGGPIIRKKLFIFGAYEGVRSQVGNTEQLLSPATDSLGGDPANSIPDAISDLASHGISVNPLSQSLLTLFPTTSTGVLNVGFPNRNRNDNFVIKSDLVINEHNNVTGRYFFGDSLQTERDVPVLREEWMSQSKLRAQVVGFNWTWAPNSHLVNEARFGYNRFWQTILTADHDKEPFATYGINTGITDPVNFGMPEVLIDGFSSLGGNHSWPLYTTPNTTWQFVDNVSWVHNRHTLRFGGEARYGKTQNLRDRYGKTQIRFRGCFALCTTNPVPDPIDTTPLEDFLAGDPGRGRLFLGNSRREVSIKSFGAFVQDEWRISPRLTLNAGVRYDLNTVIKEAHNLLGNFDPAVGLIQVGVNGVHDPYNGDHNNFAPRAGLIWDPWGNGKTVIRSGFGMTYEIPHLAIFLGQNGVNNASTAGLNVIPTGAVGVSPSGGNILASSTNISGGPGTTLNWSAAGPIFNTTTIDCSASPCDILAVDRHLRTPYVFNWNVNVQRELWKDSSIQVAYVGSSGHRQYSVYDINQVDPKSVAEDPTLGCDHCEQAGRPFNTQFPFLEFINFMSNGYGSNYHGLQTTLTQRTYKGLNFVLGYTWSHSIDSASLNRAAQPQNSFNPGAERGNSDLDIRHRVTLSSTWDLPGKKGFAQMMEGWTLNNIVTLQTGLPYTGTDFENDVSLTGEFSDRWNMFGRSADFPWSTAAPGDPGSKFTFLADGRTDPRCLAVANGDQLAAFGCYIGRNNSILAPADAGSFGNLGRNTFRADGIGNWDFSIVKRFKITEKMGMQFRAEFFNLLNTPQFADPSILFNNDLGIPGTFGVAASTPDVAAANPVIGTGGPRNIQLGLKFSW
jgi:hypothetical protein